MSPRKWLAALWRGSSATTCREISAVLRDRDRSPADAQRMPQKRLGESRGPDAHAQYWWFWDSRSLPRPSEHSAPIARKPVRRSKSFATLRPNTEETGERSVRSSCPRVGFPRWAQMLGHWFVGLLAASTSDKAPPCRSAPPNTQPPLRIQRDPSDHRLRTVYLITIGYVDLDVHVNGGHSREG